MKSLLRYLLIGLASVAGIHQAKAQLPVITTFSQNGFLVCSNLSPGLPATLAWSSSLSGPWQTNWATFAALGSVIADSNGLIHASVPMFYRVLGVPYPTNGLTVDGMALIPAGIFTMGNSVGDSDIADALPTNIFVSAFYMDTNLVSLTKWQGVYSFATNIGYTFNNAGAGKAANHPVETVDWFSCVKWSNARSQQAGLTPVYYTDAGFTQVYTNGETNVVYQNLSANGYRLPTEAEWEKAARGGASGLRFPWGNTISESQANYYADPSPPNSGGSAYDLGPYTGYNTNFEATPQPFTSPAGYFPANACLLYDIAGNVAEWCWDLYGTPYGQPTMNNPTGPGSGSGTRVCRGGAWYYRATYARCANRAAYSPGGAFLNVGFRCARGL